jgi:hypothetical protein
VAPVHSAVDSGLCDRKEASRKAIILVPSS